MKISLSASILTAVRSRQAAHLTLAKAILAGLVLVATPHGALALGEDNPAGVAGVFNGNSTTGGSYDPYTANAQRIIPDLTVAGAVGAYPLQWARIMNSRIADAGFFGQGGGWRHSYQWSVTAPYGTTNPPASVTVKYPDGREITFTHTTGTTYTSPSGVVDRFQGVVGFGNCSLLLSDGGEVVFYQKVFSDGQGGYNVVYDPPTQIIDPYGQVTVLTNYSGRLIGVTEPAGRALSIYYGTNGFISEVDALAADGHVSQWVKYTYQSQTFGSVPYNVLIQADYIYAQGLEPQPIATYTYQASNISSSGTPLINTCRDVRYPGPMKNIKYSFVAFNGTYGQLSQEQNTNGTMVAQLTFFANQRFELRGDGTNYVRSGLPTRTWTYGATLGPNGDLKNYLLKSYTDFQGNTTTLSYDVNGHVSSITDAHTPAHVTSFVRLAATGAITKITHPGDSSHIDYTYEDPTTGYYLKTVTDERGKLTTFKHDSAMNITEIDYPDGGIEKFTYDTNNGFNQVLTHTMPSPTSTDGAATDSEKYSYDSDGRLLTYTPQATTSDPAPSPHPTRYHYDANDHVDTITDPKLNVTTLYHNEIGQVTWVLNGSPDPGGISYVYNADGTLASQYVQLNSTDWSTTSYVYDDYKRVKTVTNPTLHPTNFYYDVAGGAGTGLDHTDANVSRLVLPSGKVTQTLYDENLRKGQVTVGYGSGYGAVTTYTYDAVGNLQTMKDPNGQTTGATWTYNYDVRERLINVLDPLAADRNSLGHTIDYTYDVANNKATERRANDQIVSYNSYDEMNRLTQMTVQQAPTADAVTTYTWSNSGKLLSMIDPRLHTYSYAYDRLNRLVTATYPLFNGANPKESYLYDIAGNLLTFTNRNGNVETFTYDSRNREKTYTWSTGLPQARTLIYDYASRITSCNTSSSKINFVYNDDNTVKSQEAWTTYFGDSNGTTNHRTITYTYNEDGNRLVKAMPQTITQAYEYTARNQISAVTHFAGGESLVDYTYDKNGNVLTRSPDNTTSSNFVYDAVNRVTKITHNFVGSTRVLNYAYDSVGNRQYEHRDNNLGNDDFDYDVNNQLTDFTRSATLGSNTTAAFTFDASGNRSKLVKDTATINYTINNFNGYATVTGVANPTYDNGGNLLSYNGATFTYDSMNRLTQAVKNGITEKFYYDGLNRQVARSITGGQTVITVWDGWNVHAEFAPAATNALSVMVYGSDNDLVWGQIVNQYFYPDALGSTAHYANASGTLLESYTYDHYGKPRVYDPTGNERTGGTIYGMTRLFTGQQWHAATGLYDNRYRFLFPEIGRFLQPDPIGFAGDLANLYRYVGNNPVNWSDPSGLQLTLNNKVDGPSGGTWEYPRIFVTDRFTPGIEYPSAGPGDVFFSRGGGPGGSGSPEGGGEGGGGRKQRGFYAPRNYNRFNRALAHVVGSTALLLPAQSLRNAPALISIFSSKQLGEIYHYLYGGPIQRLAGMHSYDPAPFGTIYVARDVTSEDGFNGTYAHELSDMLVGNLTGILNPANRNEDMFGGLPGDPDVGHAVELRMFGGKIPPDQ